MGHDTQVAVEDIRWFAGYGPAAISDECSHDCDHRAQKVIAWGLSLLHYELVACCACNCRGWRSALPGSHGGIRDSFPLYEVGWSVPLPEKAEPK